MNFQWNNLPLNQRLTVVMMLSSFSTLLLASIFFITNDIFTMRQNTEDEVNSLAKIVSSSSTAAIMFDDEKAADETLNMLSNLENIKSAVIYTSDGNKLASYGTEVEFSDLAFNGNSAHQVLFSNGHIDIINPVSLDGQRLGTVFIRSDLSKLDEKLNWYLHIVAIALLSSLLFSFLLSRRLQKGIAEPIQILAATARRVTNEKNYAVRADKSGSHEIAELIDGFNEMLSEIQLRDDELAENRMNLEAKVAQRTSELNMTNSELAYAKNAAEEAAERLAHQAHHDALTGLPNRILLKERMTYALSHAQREGEKLALMFLDLDGFKLINDSLGHEVGDQLLQWVAKLLTDALRTVDTVARLGGDEFMVLIPGIKNNRDAGVIAEKILKTLHQPLDCCGHELQLSVSIGISIYPDDAQGPIELMSCADSSMYRAKAGGRNNYMYYQVDIGNASSRRLALENQLRKAVVNNELFLEYQPQVLSSNQQVIGVEALVRWNNPKFGILSPDQFIPIAEDVGFIHEIGEWVMFEACNQAKKWRDAGHDNLKMAVNLSPRQFIKNSVELLVKNALGESRLPAHCLEVEITENLSMQNVQKTINTLHTLNDMGVKIAIDDFGTGYSSLNYLSKYPIHTLKIDRSFVKDIPHNRDDAALAKAIVVMAHGLGLNVVAEGVETQQQVDYFTDVACDILQGYYFGKPLSADALSNMLEDFSLDLPEDSETCELMMS